jgi:myo-inositol-1(or 4)-monophosphatase
MNLKLICEQTIEISKKAGAYIKQEALTFDRSKIEMKGFNDLVSYVDKQAEVQLVKALKKIVPEAGFITEEGTDTTRQERFNWIIDPLDGTTNFTHGLQHYAVSVALMEYNEIILGVIYNPSHDECYYAYKGGGAYLNDAAIQVSDAPALKDSLIATGFPYYDFNLTQQYLQVLGSFMSNSHGVRRIGSAALDLAYVAAGRCEGFFEYNLKPWDVAAGIIIVLEAGGKLSKFTADGDYLFGGEIVASNGNIHQEMIATIAAHWQKGLQ